MSQSTTSAGSQTQNDICEQRLRRDYPDRQDAYSSQESFSFSQNVPLTQLSHNSIKSDASVCPDSLKSVSATPTPKEEEEDQTRKDDEDKMRKAIAKMNADLTRHGYQAFVHENTHFIFRTFPFDLSIKK